MRIAFHTFNSFFLTGILALLLSGPEIRGAEAQSPKPTEANDSKPKKKPAPYGILRLFLEANEDSNSAKAQVIRRLPQTYPVQQSPFIDERDIVRATVVEAPDGGFMIQVELTQPHGRQALEMGTVSSLGRHLLIFGQWTTETDTKPEERWLGAPVVRNVLRTGMIVFSADMDREEADRFVEGINRVAVKLKNQKKAKSSASSTPKDKSKTSSSSTKPKTSPDSSAQQAIDNAKKP
jgi:hypothetical protein